MKFNINKKAIKSFASSLFMGMGVGFTIGGIKFYCDTKKLHKQAEKSCNDAKELVKEAQEVKKKAEEVTKKAEKRYAELVEYEKNWHDAFAALNEGDRMGKHLADLLYKTREQ